MSIETETDATSTDDVETLARSLGEAIADLPVYQEFLAAKAAVVDDEQAQELIAEFESVRNEYVEARQHGEATHEDLHTLQRKQEALHDVPVMREYLQAQTELEDRLRTLNEHVSDPLDVDFGEQAGGCCHD